MTRRRDEETRVEDRGGSGRDEPVAVDTTTPKSLGTSHSSVGPTSDRSSSSAGRERRSHTATHEHHLRRGSGSRVPTQESLDALEEALDEAFIAASPAKAWEAAKAIVDEARVAVTQAGAARFAANFGTARCDSCEGLRAGPGISATCFQRKLCYFTNFREEAGSARQLRVITALSKSTKD